MPADVKLTLGELFLDFLRVGSIGARMPWSDWGRNYVAQLGGNGNSPILFDKQRRDPVRAAFLNTVYAGSIDADDTHVGSMLHPGSIVFSAALALGVQNDCSGRDFIAAVAAGYEAMIRIGLSIQPSHFKRGFQSTATCGGFGAATAAARLAFQNDKRADKRIADAIGIVSSFAGGLTQFYQSGSTVKRIHAAHAAESGVAAAMLVFSGFSGPNDILEGSNGFARAYADGVDFSIVTNGLGQDFRLREVTTKSHACSARVQAAIEGVLDLCTSQNIRPDQIAEIFVGIPSVIVGRLTIPRPVDVQAAQMSLPFSVALAAAHADRAGEGFALDVSDYDSGMTDKVVSDLESRVRWEVTAEVEAATTPESVPARIILKLKSGAEHTVFISAPKGSPSRPFTHADHLARFRRELSTRWSGKICDDLIAAADDLSAVDRMSSIAELLT